MEDKPSETLRFPTAEGKLYVGVKLNENGKVESADRMFVQHFTGDQDDVLIFQLNDQRQVMRIIPVMGFNAPHPSGPVYTFDSNVLEEVNEENKKHLFAKYDQFDKRTYKFT